MPRGTPDGNATIYGYAVKEIDPAAIYQYLWGFSPIDGAGRLVYLDTFNCGLGGFRLLSSGGGLDPVISNQDSTFPFFVPPNVCNLDPGGTNDGRSQLARELFFGKTKRIGLEVGLTVNNSVHDFFCQCDYNPVSGSPYTGGFYLNVQNGYIRTSPETTPIQYIYQNGAAFPTNIFMIQIKIVMDFSTGKFVRALIGDQLFDISDYPLSPSSSSLEGYATTFFSGYSLGTALNPVKLGYVLITKDEP